MTRVDMYEQFAVSAFPQHRLVPGKKLFGVLDVWRVNGRGSLANERTHSVWKKLPNASDSCEPQERVWPLLPLHPAQAPHQPPHCPPQAAWPWSHLQAQAPHQPPHCPPQAAWPWSHLQAQAPQPPHCPPQAAWPWCHTLATP
ncbi:hypothetical protein CYMTET_32068 [Cymbomonas tetramitiformis]|uniref:Uncharacterized protein n=1 Tax=Cymbomonas tetramitiformis TaxID=36881 RepID=A0AAE0FFK6_9CHLO|nr:hypothetical protein CYMTET_32068 [Cymbomonas tetramitiformis]